MRLVNIFSILPLVILSTKAWAGTEEHNSRCSGLPYKWAYEEKETIFKYKNKDYSLLRKYYIQSGWTPKIEDRSSDKKFPEIACGEGYSAVCLATLCKSDGKNILEFNVHLDSLKGRWIVLGLSEV